MVTKVKDGLFLGDLESSQDPEFIELNKITRIINCAASQAHNIWAQHGIRYLNLDWDESGDFFIIDGNTGVLLKQIKSFIDGAFSTGDCVLVHSLDGNSRAVTCVLCYLMFRYWWSLEKAYEYLLTKKPDMNPQKGFMHQLYLLDKRLRQEWGEEKNDWCRGEGAGGRWAERSRSNPAYLRTRCHGWSIEGLSETDTSDEVIVVNTFLNSKHSLDSIPPVPVVPYEDHISSLVRWLDESKGPVRKPLERPPNRSYSSLAFEPPAEACYRKKQLSLPRKSALKKSREQRSVEEERDLQRLQQKSGSWERETPEKRLHRLLKDVTASRQGGGHTLTTPDPYGAVTPQQQYYRSHIHHRTSSASSAILDGDGDLTVNSGSEPCTPPSSRPESAGTSTTNALDQDWAALSSSEGTNETASHRMSVPGGGINRGGRGEDLLLGASSASPRVGPITASSPRTEPATKYRYSRSNSSSSFEDPRRSAGSATNLHVAASASTPNLEGMPSMKRVGDRPLSLRGHSASSSSTLSLSEEFLAEAAALASNPFLSTRVMRGNSLLDDRQRGHGPVRVKNTFEEANNNTGKNKPPYVKTQWAEDPGGMGDSSNAASYDAYFQRAAKGSPRPRTAPADLLTTANPLFQSPRPARTYRNNSPIPQRRSNPAFTAPTASSSNRRASTPKRSAPASRSNGRVSTGGDPTTNYPETHHQPLSPTLGRPETIANSQHGSSRQGQRTATSTMSRSRPASPLVGGSRAPQTAGGRPPPPTRWR